MTIHGTLTPKRLLVYFFLYIPFVWIEWSIMASVMTQRWRPLKEFLTGASSAHIRWKALGTLITVTLEFPQLSLRQVILRLFASPESA